MNRNDPEPTRARRWLERHLPPDLADAILGDLAEAAEHDAATRGVASARRRYWREAILLRLTAHRLPTRAGPSPLRETPMSQWSTDLRHAMRIFVRQRAFSLFTVLTLALGIGATTAIFSVVKPILLDPLPYPEPARIMTVWEESSAGESNIGYESFTDLRGHLTSFSAVAAMGSWAPIATEHGDAEMLQGQRVTSGYFSVLGVTPALGRAFAPEDDLRGEAPVVILSHALWQRRFAGDRAVLGRSVMLNGLPHTVIGVMPPAFENITAPGVEVWRALRYDASLSSACRTCRHLRMVGRIAPTVSRGAADAELTAVGGRMIAAHAGDYPAGARLMLRGLQDQVTRGVRPALMAVLGAVALVLLTACANVTSLLLARGAQRQGEFALRGALGAGRARVIRQLLTESIVLTLAGGALGVLVALAGVRVLVSMGPDLPRLHAVRVDPVILAAALGITLAVGIASGLAPALHAARRNLQGSLKAGARGVAGTGSRLRQTLVVAEVALAMVLLIGSGLLLRSMHQLLGVSPGFDRAHLLTMQIQAGGTSLSSDSLVRQFYTRVLDAAAGVPGVQAAALTSQLPLSEDYDGFGVHSETHSRANPAENPSTFRYAVTPGYLETMGIPLLRGRSIVATDQAGTPQVAVISQGLARTIFGDDDPIGERVRIGGNDEGNWWTIVGVTGDVKQTSLAAEASEGDGIYVPGAQWFWADTPMSLVVRTAAAPEVVAAQIRAAVHQIDRDQPITRVATMDQLLATSTAERRFVLLLFQLFGAVTLVLAAGGLYGLLAGMVTDRLPEMAVRATFGATHAQLLALVIRQGLLLTAAGLTVGVAASLLLTRGIATFLFQVPRIDPVTYLAVLAGLGAVGVAASWLPAQRAARIDPARILRRD